MTKKLEDDGIPEPRKERAAGAADRHRRTRLAGTSQDAAPEDFMADPVVGWAVVVEGSGKGSAFRLGYGENTIGREKDQAVCLDFGVDRSDPWVSGSRHAVITYYAREKLFRVRHELGRNPTYLNDEPLLQPTPLKAGDMIVVGDTRLRFVPLCGEDFDWNAE